MSEAEIKTLTADLMSRLNQWTPEREAAKALLRAAFSAEEERRAQVESKLNDALVELENVRAELEIADRDAGIHAAALQLSAHALGCDTHMVDHAVKDLLAELQVCRTALKHYTT